MRQRYDREEAWHALAVVEEIEQENGRAPAAIALAWLLAHVLATFDIQREKSKFISSITSSFNP